MTEYNWSICGKEISKVEVVTERVKVHVNRNTQLFKFHPKNHKSKATKNHLNIKVQTPQSKKKFLLMFKDSKKEIHWIPTSKAIFTCFHIQQSERTGRRKYICTPSPKNTLHAENVIKCHYLINTPLQLFIHKTQNGRFSLQSRFSCIFSVRIKATAYYRFWNFYNHFVFSVP